MIARISALTAALVLAAGAALAAAAPASAYNGGGSSGGGVSTGCQGANCDINWWQWVKYSGTPGVAGKKPSGSQVAVDVQQPPCTWDYIGNQHKGSRYIVNFFAPGPAPGALYNIYNSYQLAEKLLNDGPAAPEGRWFNLPVNMAASEAAQQECLKLPAFVFVRPWQTPPLPPIPPRILAELGFDHMKLPSPVVHTSPAGFGYVNLATFVWWTNVPGKILHTTASLPDGQSATVVAKLADFSVSGSGAATDFSKCSPTSGSRQPRNPPPATGAGVGPDCGVLWTQPDSAATITVTLTWKVLWHPGPWQAVGNQFYGTGVHGAPAAGIPTKDTVGPFTIREIQSVNGAS